MFGLLSAQGQMSMSEEAFLRAIADLPYDIEPRLVYADWLEEHGDPRAQKVRAECRYRLPITPQETRHLTAIAAARERADASQVVVAVNPSAPGYALGDGMTGFGALAEDLKHLSPREVARIFPRDDKGRLQLNCTVLLDSYRCTEAVPRYRELWLTATGPARRSDPQVITVKLDLLIGENHAHNWSQERWWWDRRCASYDDQARWGITGAALRAVTGPRRGKRVAELQAGWRVGKLTPAERISLCTVLQDEGRFEEALRISGVEYPEELSRLLNGEKFRLPGGCDHPAAEAMSARAAKLRRALWEAAPWRFAQGLEAAQARLDAWRQERSGRSAMVPQLRLFIFPGSTHARKPGLMLVPNAAGQPRLSIVFTASNVVLPESHWKRPVELDIARWCDIGKEGKGTA
jgi:uncharacterized protein (TIGR02996 family)